jgi:hypothetical protein
VRSWCRQAGVVGRLEFTLLVRGTPWRVCVVLSVLLAVIATVAGVRTSLRQHDEANLLAMRRAEVIGTGERRFGGFERDESFRIIRPVAAAGVLVRSRVNTEYLDAGPDGLTVGTIAPPFSTVTADESRLDLEFIFRALMGLLAIVTGASSLVAARHRGFARSLVALPVHPSAMMAGALAGGLAAIGLASAAVIAASLVTLSLNEASMMTDAILATSGLMWAASVVYGAVLQGIGMIVALWARSAVAVSAESIAIWLVVAIVAIPIVGALVPAVSPVAPRALFEAERRSLYQNTTARIELAAGDIVVRHRGPRASVADIPLDGPLLEEINALWDAEIRSLRTQLQTIETDHREDEAASTRWMHRLSVPLPGALFRSAVMELADAGHGSAGRWDHAARSYQQALNVALFDARPRIAIRVRRAADTYWVFGHDRAPLPTVSDLPAFVPSDATVGMRLLDAAPALAWLGLHAAMAWLAAIVTFSRRSGRQSH